MSEVALTHATINGKTRAEIMEKLSEPLVVKAKSDIITRLNDIFSVFNYDLQMGEPAGETYVKLHARIVIKDDSGSPVIRKDACSGYYVADIATMPLEEAKKQTDDQLAAATLDIYCQIMSSLGVPLETKQKSGSHSAKKANAAKKEPIQNNKNGSAPIETVSNNSNTKAASQDNANEEEDIPMTIGSVEEIATSVGSVQCVELQICTEFEEKANGSLWCKVRNLHHPAEGMDLNKMPTLVIWNSKVSMIEESHNVSKERFVRSYKPETILPCKCIREAAGDKVFYRFEDVWIREKKQ